MNLHMHQIELKAIAESILLQNKKRISSIETQDKNGKNVCYFILLDTFMILETLKPTIKNDPGYSQLSNTYKIDFDETNKNKEGEGLLYFKQLLNCAIIYELPKMSEKWLTSLEDALATTRLDLPLMEILKDKILSELLSAFKEETGAKKYDYNSDFETNNLDICFAMVRDFRIEEDNFSSDFIRQTVLDSNDFYYLETNDSKQLHLTDLGLYYEALGLFSKTPHKKKIYINKPEERVEIGECLDCGTLLEEQKNVADKFILISNIVKESLLTDVLCSQYLTVEKLKKHLEKAKCESVDNSQSKWNFLFPALAGVNLE